MADATGDRTGVVIADDDPGVRAALGELIDDHPRLFLLAAAATGTDAAMLCARHKAPLAVIDVMMPDGGTAAVEAIHVVSPATKVVAYTVLTDRRTREKLLTSGAVLVLAKGGAEDIATSLAELLSDSATSAAVNER